MQERHNSILIVDDDPEDREMFMEAVTGIDRDIRCYCAFDGENALEVLTSLPALPDFIFLDLNMPRMDGIGCLSEIKQQPKYHTIPVIIYSTSLQQEDVAAAYALGAAKFITKPNRFEELENALSSILVRA